MKNTAPLAAILSLLLGVPASAVVRAAAPRPSGFVPLVLPFAASALGARGLSLPAPALAPVLTAPAAAPSARLAAAAASMAPALELIAAGAAPAQSRAAADAVMDRLLELPAAADAPAPSAAVAAAPTPAPRLDPAAAQRKFARGVSPRARALFTDTLKRRQAGWRQGLANMGVKPGAPLSLAVTKSADRSPGAAAVVTETSFDVEWSQGPTRVGAFKVAVRLKDLRVTFSRAFAPAAPAARQLRVRVLPGMTPAELTSFFEARGLRVLRQGRKDWMVAATGKTTAASAVKRLNREKRTLLYAVAASRPGPKAGRLVARLRAGVDDARVAALLRAVKVAVVEEGRDGFWTFAPAGKPSDSLRRLRASADVLYAMPAALKDAEVRQLVVRFKKGTDEAAIAARLSGKAWGVDVVRDFGDGLFKLQSRIRRNAAFFAADPVVESAVAVGGVSEASVRGSAASTASHKGRPWSSTEFNAQTYYSRVHLETLGATKTQLELFDRLVNEAPVLGGGFNPWSGD